MRRVLHVRFSTSPSPLASVWGDFQRAFSSSPADFSAAIQAAITSPVCDHLSREGYAVVDGVLPPSLCETMRNEIDALHKGQLTIKNHTHLVRSEKASSASPDHQQQRLSLLEKTSIWEADFKDPRVRAASPLFSAVQDDTALRTLLSLFLPKLPLASQALKLQFNAGAGGCFPIHFDADPSLDTRKVTAIFYLNPRPSGGQLRLYPFPRRRHIDIEPVEGRMVLFSSTGLLHRVLPSNTDRHCFTIWLAGPPARGRGRPSPSAAGGPFDSPEVLRHALRLVYAREWERSLIESHPAGPELEAALETNRAEVALIRKALGKWEAPIQRATEWAEATEGGDGAEGFKEAAGAKVSWF